MAEPDALQGVTRVSKDALRREPARRAFRRTMGRIVLLVVVVLTISLLYGHHLLTHPFGKQDSAVLLMAGTDQPVGGRARSDSLWLLHIYLRPHPRIVGVSLPRDTRVTIPDHGTRKLNAAFALGGLPLTERTITASFGIHPDYHLALASDGLGAVVDSLGGVMIEVPRRMDYDDQCQNLHIHLRPGVQRLTGQQSVGFVRFRSDGLGDIGRIGRQKLYLKAIAKAVLSPAALPRWPAFLRTVPRAVQTDLTTVQLLGMAYSLRKLRPEQMTMLMLPGRAQYLHGVSYYLPSGSVSPLLAGQAPNSGSLFTIALIDASGHPGAGLTTARRLRAAGFRFTAITSTGRHIPRTTIAVPNDPTAQEQARRLQQFLPDAVITATTSGGVTVTLGQSFHSVP